MLLDTKKQIYFKTYEMWDKRSKFCDVLYSVVRPVQSRMILGTCSAADFYSSPSMVPSLIKLTVKQTQ